MNEQQPASGSAPWPWPWRLAIPSALLGLLVFFLPWIEFSCGPVHVTVSGYEVATGRYENKLGTFPDQERGGIFDQSEAARRQGVGWNSTSVRFTYEGHSDALLWIVPIGCVLLILAVLLGLPERICAIPPGIAAAYLAYFSITTEQKASDPHYTQGVVDHHWLIAYWTTWLALLYPVFIAILRPKPR